MIIRLFASGLIWMSSVVSAAATLAELPLTESQQIEIIEDFLYAKGMRTAPSTTAAADLGQFGGAIADPLWRPVKCGNGPVNTFKLYFDQLDARLLNRYGITSAVLDRPQLPNSVLSPSERFRIHYATTGDSAVFQATVDANGNQVPDFVDATALIADSVFTFFIDSLGYPIPPTDEFYPSGGDAAYDVYLVDLGTGFFGLAYQDSILDFRPDSVLSTTYVELDNDYQGIPAYRDRPLDAVRVTLAHELFHLVQFGIDATEYDLQPQPNPVRRYWMEMSAVWMEELLYDDINDYYSYLPTFFSFPRASLQRFSSFADPRPYGAAIFVLYLEALYGRDIVREIWFRARDLGAFGQFFLALDQVVDSASGGTEDLASTLDTWHTWNLFTGDRWFLAPPGYGYEERINYPGWSDDDIAIRDTFTFVQVNNADNGIGRPEYNGAAYYRWDNLNAMPDPPGDRDTLFDYFYTLQRPPAQQYVTKVLIPCDPLAPVEIIPGPRTVTAPSDIQSFADTVINPQQYSSVWLIPSISTTNISLFYLLGSAFFSYGIRDTSGAVPSEPCGAVPPTTDIEPLLPFPNPINVAAGDPEAATFRFQISATADGVPLLGEARAVIDIFTATGDRVTTLESTADPVSIGPELAAFEVVWDLTNESGRAVASGVYYCMARLFSVADELLAESDAKIAIIR